MVYVLIEDICVFFLNAIDTWVNKAMTLFLLLLFFFFFNRLYKYVFTKPILIMHTLSYYTATIPTCILYSRTYRLTSLGFKYSYVII